MRQKVFLFLSVCIFFHVASVAQLPKIKIACIGNSVTYGYGLKDPATQSYPAQLQSMLGDSYKVKNFGHSGATLLRKGHRPYYKTDAFKEALQFVPDIVIIHLGLNDTDPRNWNNYRNEFKSDYTWLIDQFKNKKPNAKIFICRMTPIFHRHPRFESGTREWFWQIQKEITEIAAANHTGLIDLHTGLYSRPDLFPDALHPNAAGAEILTKIVYKAITGDYGGLQMPRIFSNDMVMQRGMAIPVFGTANVNEEITVQFNNKQKKVKASADGKWKVTFDALPAGGPYNLFVSTNDKKLVFTNILLGDVWLCSGQSNMVFRLDQSKGGKEEMAIAANNNIRLFLNEPIAETADKAWDSATLEQVNSLAYFTGKWKNSTPANAGAFSAVAYYFGKKIQAEANVPIGLIQVAVGGAPILAFMNRYWVEHDNYLVNELYDWTHSDYYMPWVRERAIKNLSDSKEKFPRHPYQPCYIFESGIEPFTHMPLKGVLWYQGESDAHNIELYAYNFKQFIKSWRHIWGEKLPFYFVQLSSIDRPSWGSFRDMQRKVSLAVPNTFMALSSDWGDSLNVHPINKKPIGERLALLALKHSYNKNITAAGPVIANASQQGDKIVVRFSNAKKLSTRNHETLTGFEIMNEKGKIISPRMTINGNEVWLRLDVEEKIIKVLYGYQPFTRANLQNEAGLPASTFSLDVVKQ